jgi:hypothetical protein
VLDARRIIATHARMRGSTVQSWFSARQAVLPAGARGSILPGGSVVVVVVLVLLLAVQLDVAGMCMCHVGANSQSKTETWSLVLVS